MFVTELLKDVRQDQILARQRELELMERNEKYQWHILPEKLEFHLVLMRIQIIFLQMSNSIESKMLTFF